MSKAILQSVGDDTVAFNDQCYWVAEHVKKFLNGFQPGMEVDVTVKDVEGTPMVTFLKKAGFAPAQGARPSYPQSGGQGFGSPSYPPRTSAAPAPRAPAAAPSGGGLGDQALFTLAATIAVAYNVDADAIREMVAVLKRPPTPPPVPAPVAPPVLPGEPSY